MRGAVIPKVVVLGAVALWLIGWWALPWMQSPQRRVNAQTGRQLERARRLLHQFQVGLAFKSVVLTQLRESELDVDLSGDPEEFHGEALGAFEQYRAEAWERYRPTDWSAEPPRPARAPSGADGAAIRSGVSSRDRMFQDNERILEQALHAVDQALTVQVGDATARSYAEALRLKAAIFLLNGSLESTRAMLLRNKARSYLDAMARLSTRAAASASASTRVTDSGIDGRIEEARKQARDAQARLRESEKELQALEDTIALLDQRLLSAMRTADEARAAMERLKERGIESTAPQAARDFETGLSALDRTYRAAWREIRATQHGTYADAQLVRHGDYLHGRYINPSGGESLTIEYGISYFHSRRGLLTRQIETRRKSLEVLQEDVTRLESLRQTYTYAQQHAVEELRTLKDTISRSYEEWNRLSAEAFAIEDKALTAFAQGERIANQASQAAREWVRAAGEQTRDLPPEERERSGLFLRTNDNWIVGHMEVLAADADLERANVQISRFQAYIHAADILDSLGGEVSLSEANPDAERQKAHNAREGGIELVAQAISRLERVHSAVGGHWTVTAQEAAAIDLLVMFGEEGYRQEAIEAYRLAVQGREDKGYAQTIVARLNSLAAKAR